jgi:lipopolysaccharide export system protein LptA
VTFLDVNCAAVKSAGLKFATLSLLAFAVVSPAAAQLTPFAEPADKNDKAPLEITADGTLEWLQDVRAYVARKNAVATRGPSILHADTLTAFYRESPKDAKKPPAEPKPEHKKGESNDADPGQIWRVIAEGGVKIENNGRTAYGDRAVYDVDKKVVVLTGGDLKVITPIETVTAKDSIEYWEETETAVARGNALARKKEDTLAGDVLVAHFTKDEKGSTSLNQVEGFGNVVITTPKDVVRGAHGTYDMRTRRATISGPAKFAQSKTAGPPAPGTPPGPAKTAPVRVRGLFVPKNADDKPTAAAPGASAQAGAEAKK